MNPKILFAEKQRFNQWWLWLILLGINGLFLLGVFQQIVHGQDFGSKPMSNTGLLIVTGFTILLTLLFASFRLDTLIKEDGIAIRFFPIHFKFKHYAWDSLKKSYVRAYAPIAEYGGWGLRTGLSGKNKAYNISGNMGLQLEFTNHTKLLIGTKKPKELNEALLKIGQLKK